MREKKKTKQRKTCLEFRVIRPTGQNLSEYKFLSLLFSVTLFRGYTFLPQFV